MDNPQFYVGLVMCEGYRLHDFYLEEGEGCFVPSCLFNFEETSALFDKITLLRDTIRHHDSYPEFFSMAKELQDRHMARVLDEFEENGNTGLFEGCTTSFETHCKVLYPLLNVASKMPPHIIKSYCKERGIRPTKGKISFHRDPQRNPSKKNPKNKAEPTKYLRVEDYYDCAAEKLSRFTVYHFFAEALEGEMIHRMFPNASDISEEEEDDLLDCQLEAFLEE